MQHNITAPRIRAAPRTEPITIPAIAPPESPDPLLAAAPGVAVPLLLVAEGEDDEVEDGNRAGTVEKTGRLTPVQRVVAFEPTQQESVAFGELVAQ